MTLIAAGLVLTGALFNATFNLLFKKASGGSAFVWLAGCLSAIFYLPVAGWFLLVKQTDIGLMQVALLMGCATLHVAYYIMLNKGYQIGDLSVIYPLVRGTGPLLCTLVAVILLGEKLTPQMVAGTLFIVTGIVFVTGHTMRWTDPKTKKTLFFALSCGSIIAAYTVLDKAILRDYYIPPLFMAWFSEFGRSVLLLPYAAHNWTKVKEQWRINKKLAIGVGVLGPLGYLFILTALSISSVSFVAPLREFSILIGVVMGTRLLEEGNAFKRLIGAGAMLIGLASMTMS